MTKQIKKHRHLRLLGQIDGNHLHKVPRDYVECSEFLPLLTKALKGDLTGLLKILNSREKDRLYSFLNNQTK